MNIFHQTFSTGDVVKAAGVTSSALQTWIRRGLIIGQKPGEDAKGVDMPGQAGIRRAFSFFNVMEIAVAAALIRHGHEPATAFRAGAGFAHTSSTCAHRAGLMRLPGLPYPQREGRTVVCVSGDRSKEELWDNTAPGSDVLSEIMVGMGQPEAVTVLWVNPLFQRAVLALGHNPQNVFAIAYPEHE